MCGLVRTRSAVAGSSSSACTAAQCTCQAATGSSSGDGPRASSTAAPAERNAGSHWVRCRTTSRATQPATGEGASQRRVPRTWSVNKRPTCRWRSAGRSDSAIGEHPLEPGVSLVDAGLHAASQPGIPGFEAVDERLRAQPGPAVAEILDPQRLERNALRLSLEGEGLHDTVRADLVKAAVERVLDLTIHRCKPPAAAGAGIPVLDPGAQGVRANPLTEQLGIGVGPEQLGRCRCEI